MGTLQPGFPRKVLPARATSKVLGVRTPKMSDSGALARRLDLPVLFTTGYRAEALSRNRKFAYQSRSVDDHPFRGRTETQPLLLILWCPRKDRQCPTQPPGQDLLQLLKTRS